MKNILKSILVLSVAVLPFFALADVSVNFSNNYATTTAGSSLILTGTLTNNSTTTPVYITGLNNLFVIPLNIGSTSVPSIFANSSGDSAASFALLPSTLAPSQQYSGNLAVLNINATTTPGDYFGGYNLFGGTSQSATNTPISFQTFYIHVNAGTSTSTYIPPVQGLQFPAGLSFQDASSINGSYQSGPRLIKLEGSNINYWVSPLNFKLPMWNDAVFKSYKNNPADVQTVSQSEFDYYQDAKYIRLIGNGKIYKIQGRTKYPIPSEIWNNSGIDAAQIIDINKTDFNSYKNGKTLTSPDQL